ncbi:hypothetical protein HDU93_001906, partial [Gonapodya sp. JEL0774]
MPKDERRNPRKDDKRDKDDVRDSKKRRREEYGESGKLTAEVKEKLSEDDYFRKSSEFRLWLQKKGKEADSTKEARKLFVKFVKKWNAGELDATFYGGVTPAQSRKNTGEGAWHFKGITKEEINRTVSEVQNATEGSAPSASATSTSRDRSERHTGPTLSEEDDARDRSREEYLAKRRKEARDTEAALDMVAPKETGREAMLLKKAARKRGKKEDDYDVVLPDKELYGEGESFKSTVEMERRRLERREQVKARDQRQVSSVTGEKLRLHQEKEQALMDQFRKMAAESAQLDNTDPIQHVMSSLAPLLATLESYGFTSRTPPSLDWALSIPTVSRLLLHLAQVLPHATEPRFGVEPGLAVLDDDEYEAYQQLLAIQPNLLDILPQDNAKLDGSRDARPQDAPPKPSIEQLDRQMELLQHQLKHLTKLSSSQLEFREAQARDLIAFQKTAEAQLKTVESDLSTSTLNLASALERLNKASNSWRTVISGDQTRFTLPDTEIHPVFGVENDKDQLPM